MAKRNKPIKEICGRTARQWLVELAQSHKRRTRVDAHIALEEVYAELSRLPEGSIGRFASSAYENITQRQLTMLINAVDKK